MQLVVPALHSGGRRIGDVLPIRRPPHVISPAAKLLLILLPGPGEAHAVVDHDHEPELPALPLDRRPELPCRHSLHRLRLCRDHRVPMGKTDVVAQVPQLLKSGGRLTELSPVLPADGVDDEVRMGVVRIAVGADQHLMSRPGPLRELQRQRVGVCVGDGIAGIEGLRVLIEVDAAGFAVDLFRQHEFVKGSSPAAVDAADELSSAFRIEGLFLLLTVFHDAAHGAGALLVLLDVVQGCHDRSSVRARSWAMSAACCAATSSRPGT